MDTSTGSSASPSPVSQILRRLLVRAPDESGPKKKITEQEWFQPDVQELIEHASPQLNRVLASLYANDHFELDPEVQHDIAAVLRERGYPLPEKRPEAFDRTQRRDFLYEIRAGNVSEPDVEFERLRQATGRSAPTLVGIIDGGFNVHHPLLEHRLWTAKTADGMIVHGKNLADGSRHLYGASLGEGDHGSHVAGIATNGTTYVKAALLKVDLSNFNYEQVKKAVEYGAENHVRIFNTSLLFQGKELTQKLLELVRAHPEILFVKSAGNDGAQLGTPTNYASERFFAANELDNLVVVASATAEGYKDKSSNFSARYATVAMRGRGVMSLGRKSAFAEMTGTSMASPYVAGIAARMLVLDPALQPNQIKRLLIEATPPSEWWEGLVASGGVVDPRTAMRLAAISGLLRDGKSPAQVAAAVHLKAGEVQRLTQIVQRVVGV